MTGTGNKPSLMIPRESTGVASFATIRNRHTRPSSGDKALCLPVQGLDPEDTTALVACLAASGVDAFRCLVAAVATASTAPQTLTNRLSWAMSFVAHDIPRVQLVMLLPWFLTRQTGLCSASPAPGYCATVATAAADARRSCGRMIGRKKK